MTFALWAVLLVASMNLGLRHPWSGVAWFLTFAVGAWQMWRSRQQSRAQRAEWADWDARLSRLQAIRDIEDPHVQEWLDRSEWNKVFEELERLPPEHRSLRRAIAAVQPDVL